MSYRSKAQIKRINPRSPILEYTPDTLGLLNALSSIHTIKILREVARCLRSTK